MIDKKNLLVRLGDAAAVEDRSTMANLLKDAAEALRFYSVCWFDVDERKPSPGQRVLFSIAGYVSDGYIDNKGMWMKNGFDAEKMIGKVEFWAPIPKSPVKKMETEEELTRKAISKIGKEFANESHRC